MRAAALLLSLLAAPAPAQEAPAPLVLRYLCEDGRAVDAAFLRLGGQDVAVLSLDGAAPVALSSAVAASGARYVGAGLQWWADGLEEARLAPLAPGEEVASDPGTACRAAP